jgi:sugar phosphate isomerase/epimerase
MKLGVFNTIYLQLPLEEALDKLVALGVSAIEIGTGNYPGDAHCRPDALLGDPRALDRFRKRIADRGLMISALSQHGNPLHPVADRARQHHQVWRHTVLLAEALEVPVVNAFSGCPGDHEGAHAPNWVTCSWPPDYREVLEWQWAEKVVPYWTEEAAYADAHGIDIGFEMHPGFVVYNPETLLRLRSACGPRVGANFDPSHLLWQGVEPVEAIKLLGSQGAIVHVHAKDTYLDRANIARNGVLDTKPYRQVLERSWMFRTVGYGSGEKLWRDIMSALRAVGYDYVVSIEHEDSFMSRDEGLSKAVELLQNVLLREPPAQMWWA